MSAAGIGIGLVALLGAILALIGLLSVVRGTPVRRVVPFDMR